MKKKKQCPYKILIAILNQEKNIEEKVLDILKKYEISRTVVSMAQGTAPSNISDFFGFGVTERMILSTFVEADKSKEIVDCLQNSLEEDKKNKGMIFTLPLTALSSNILGLWRDNNEKREQK